jgi:hypothetical protein
MNLIISEQATNFKTKGQADTLNKEKKRKTLESAQNVESCEKNHWKANGIV